jgi:hypothetical protein
MSLEQVKSNINWDDASPSLPPAGGGWGSSGADNRERTLNFSNLITYKPNNSHN